MKQLKSIITSFFVLVCLNTALAQCPNPAQIYVLNTFESNNQIYSFTEGNPDVFTLDSALPGISGFDTYSYGMDLNLADGLIYIIASPNGSDTNRHLFTYDPVSGVLSASLGQVLSSSGNTKVQAMTFDGSGNLWAVFMGGILEQIDIATTTGISNTFAPLVMPAPFAVGLTWDFDNNLFLYGGNGSSILLHVNPTTGATINIPTTSTNSEDNFQGMDYAGNGLIYTTGTFGNDVVQVFDIATGTFTSLFKPTADFGVGPRSFKDLIYVQENCGPIVPVPTLGQWGLMCLSLILLIFGVSSIKVRNLSTSKLSLKA